MALTSARTNCLNSVNEERNQTMNRNQLTRRAALLVAALFSFSFVSAHGDSVVNSTGDGGLVYGGKYGCETDLLRGGVCTLRAAIEYANLNPDVDTITFGIPTTDPGYNAQT